MKRCLTLLIIREMQIKTTMRYGLTVMRMVVMSKSTNERRWQWSGETRVLVFCCWDVKWHSYYNNGTAVLKK